MRFSPFSMERWQSTYEHRVRFNLSESGVHPLTVGELLELTGHSEGLDDILLGYGQSNGSDELRALIAGPHEGASEANVLVTVGGAEANFTCFWHLMEQAGPAAVVLPTYGQVPGLIDSFEGKLTPVHLVEEDGWQPNMDELEAALANGARFVLITNPNNPTGASLSAEAMAHIAGRTEHYGAWILADEVYAGAETGTKATPSFWGSHDRVLVTNSLSKAYGLPGLRLGWILGPAELVNELWGRTDYTTIAPASISDTLASVALRPDNRSRIMERTRSIVRANLGLVEDWMAQQGGRFRYRAPDAGAICYTHYDAPVNSSDFAEKLRVEKDVLVVPGDHFGMDHYLRIGFGNPQDELIEALGRVREGFDEVVAGD